MTDQTVTKQDLRNLKTEIVDEITTVLADAMNAIGLNFQGLESRFVRLPIY